MSPTFPDDRELSSRSARKRRQQRPAARALATSDPVALALAAVASSMAPAQTRPRARVDVERAPSAATDRLVIAWPTAMLGVSALTSQALVDCALDGKLSPRIARMTAWLSGPLIANARTGIVQYFLEQTSAEWLLQVDTDMVFRPADVLRLLDVADPERVPIVGGLYAGTGALASATAQHVEAGWFTPDGYRRLTPTTARGPVKVDFVGAGFLLVHRSVFEVMRTRYPAPQPWFQEVAVDGRVDGEDWLFCRRATEAGLPVHVHCGVRVGHVKTRIVTV